ncbi:hypothetical protein AAC387_Pa05g0264 [Persea americana]
MGFALALALALPMPIFSSRAREEIAILFGALNLPCGLTSLESCGLIYSIRRRRDGISAAGWLAAREERNVQRE